MKKKTNNKFYIKILIIIVVIVGILSGLTWWIVDTFSPPDEHRMQRYFDKDKEDIFLIKDYFIDSGYTEISIQENNTKKGFMNTFTNDNVKLVAIEDEDVVEAINRLIEKQGYSTIGRDNNTIYFEKWIRLERGRGIAYSINGEDEPVLEFLTDLKPLSENGWYYYEDDYNKWRVQNK